MADNPIAAGERRRRWRQLKEHRVVHKTTRQHLNATAADDALHSEGVFVLTDTNRQERI